MRMPSQWLFEPAYDHFTKEEIIEVFKDAQRFPVERKPPRTTIRTERSETARHKDRLNKLEGHHSFPKYLGGLKKQILVYLRNDLHYLYHKEVDMIVKLPRGRSYKKLTPAEKKEILNRLEAHAKYFDQRFNTSILPLMQKAIRETKNYSLI
jgi:hypothetical protein